MASTDTWTFDAWCKQQIRRIDNKLNKAVQRVNEARKAARALELEGGEEHVSSTGAMGKRKPTLDDYDRKEHGEPAYRRKRRPGGQFRSKEE